LLRSRPSFARVNSLRPAPITHLVLAGILALGAGTIGHCLHPSQSAVTAADLAVATAPIEQTVQATAQTVALSAPMQAVASVKNAVANVLARPPENITRETELDDDQTFASLLSQSGVNETEASMAMNALAKVYNLHKLRAGQMVSLFFTRQGANETFTGAAFLPEATKEISIARDAKGVFTAELKVIPVVRQRLAAAGEIHSSLYDAGDAAGVPHAVMASLIRIYSHDIDFQRDIHPGDHFEILYDQPTTAQGRAVGEGSIIYAALNIGGKVRPVYRVTFTDNTVDYFDDKGHSTRRALLRTPVAAARITSGFGMRVHPLLGYSKMHKGIDFGAPMGAPIFAAGNGIVQDIGFKNGYGRFILIRHNSQISTAYAHMSRYSQNMFKGARVTQGQVIGYVGMSGRATGPHLHYEVRVAGKQINPMSINMPTGRILEGKLLTAFKAGQVKVKQEFATLVTDKKATNGYIKASSGITSFPVEAKDKL
jgi:murein DD-endopeptidase MepM/ murein hydrolase activator NlpD